MSYKPQVSATVAGQGVADPGDDAIPLPLLGGGIVDQDAIDEASGKVATIVPNLSLAKAGHHEKSRGHPFVDDVWWRVLVVFGMLMWDWICLIRGLHHEARRDLSAGQHVKA